MELLIRSQDKMKLERLNELRIVIEDEGASIVDNDFDGYILGTYKSEERAIEVLDSIENFIAREIRIRNTPYENADIEIKAKSYIDDCKIYEMPKE